MRKKFRKYDWKKENFTEEVIVKAVMQDEALATARHYLISKHFAYARPYKAVVIDFAKRVYVEPYNFDDPWYEQDLVSCDIETTGFDVGGDRIVEIGFGKFSKEDRCFIPDENFLVNPGIPIPQEATDVHSITDEMVKESPLFEEIAQKVVEKMANKVVVYHHREFDIRQIAASIKRAGITWAPPPMLCSLSLGTQTPIGQDNNKLGTLCNIFGIKLVHAHRANDDAVACGNVFLGLAKRNRKFLRMSLREAIAYL